MLLLYALVFSLLLVSSLSFSSFQSKSSFVSRLQMSAEIKVSKKVGEEIITKLGIRSWPTWYTLFHRLYHDHLHHHC